MYHFIHFRCDKCGKEIYMSEYKRQKDITNTLNVDCYVIEDNDGQKIEICSHCYKLFSNKI